MIVAITAKGAGLGAMLDDDFASSRQFVIVDDDASFSALANTFASDTSGAAFAKMIVATVHPLDAIVTRNIRAEALDILMRNGIAVYSADKGAVMDLADSARAGELPLAASTHGSSS